MLVLFNFVCILFCTCIWHCYCIVHCCCSKIHNGGLILNILEAVMLFFLMLFHYYYYCCCCLPSVGQIWKWILIKLSFYVNISRLLIWGDTVVQWLVSWSNQKTWVLIFGRSWKFSVVSGLFICPIDSTVNEVLGVECMKQCRPALLGCSILQNRYSGFKDTYAWCGSVSQVQ